MLNIICGAGIKGPEQSQVLSLPCWVLDWKWNGHPTAHDLGMKLYCAAKGTKHEIQPELVSGVLYAQGVLCDTITMFKSKDDFCGLEDLLFVRGPTDYPTNTPRLQAMFRVLIVDRYYLSDHRLNHDPGLWLFRL
jgi:hypothetical protein